MSVACICRRDVDTARRDESAFQAAERMHQHTVGALVVVAESGAPIGIVTDRDIAVRVVAAGRDAYTTTVGQIMTSRLKSVAESAPIETALSEMKQHAVRRLPVVDERGQLTGIVTLDDVLMRLAESITLVGEIVKQETPEAVVAGSSH